MSHDGRLNSFWDDLRIDVSNVDGPPGLEKSRIVVHVLLSMKVTLPAC